ncbi:hypothetical protein QR680_010162 [Steinernema hermaphroditum]|uniref:Phosphatase 2A Regulatory Subunit A helical domain-containing protein n=1 Tax=Steinernema hermaphroditum TaxID=289476 RepID=A0AA39MB79_9BILA|nr:hypothetical protein QR680_010162 [Steinernema hermaphroditum]
MGIAHSKGISLVEWYEECRRKYGNVFTVWQGPMPIVMVVDYDTIVESYLKNAEAHAGRQKAFVLTGYREYMGLVWTDGPAWQEQRRFSLRVLRDFGLGRNLMQQRILEEIGCKFERLEEAIESSPDRKLLLDPGPFLDILIGSVINRILVGYRYDESNEEELRKLKGGLDRQLDELTPIDMIVFNERTYKLPVFKQRYNTVAIPQVEILDHLMNIVNKRKELVRSGAHTIDPEDPEDYIDAYLVEMNRRQNSGEPMGSFSEKFLFMNLLDLFMAGTETSIGTLKWGLVHMLHKPEIQEKLRDEVLKITGGNRFVEIADKANMPYANAVVAENLRCSYILNFNVLHETTMETTIGDYVLPKGTVTTPQLSVALRDANVFENPLEFDPERFLTNKQLDKKVIAFGVGKRACLGESLARAEIFLVLTNFVQRFKFSPAVEGQPPKLEPLSLITNMHRVKPYKMTVQKNNQTMADVDEVEQPVEEHPQGEALIPIAVLIDELRNAELSVRVNAVRKLPTIALALGAERTREELMPFIADTIYDEDQVTHELSKQLRDFVKFVGGPEYAHHILPALENFANVEEVLVREEAVQSIKEVVKDMPSDRFEECFTPLLTRLAKADWFTSRTSACGLFAMGYERVGEAHQQEIEDLFKCLCDDDTPMVRRAAGKALHELIPVFNKNLVQESLLPIFNKMIADEQDSVRILTVDAAIAFAKHFTSMGESLEPVQRQLLSFFEDDSWRVRYTVAQKIIDLQDAVGKDFAYMEVFPLYEKLLENVELEVRARAFEHVGRFCGGLAENVREDIIIERIVPKIRHELEVVVNNEHVKTAISTSVMDLVPLICRDLIIEHLLPILSVLLMAEPATVRLNVLSSFGKVSAAIGIEEASKSLLPAVLALSDDGKWRVRLALVEAMPSLTELIEEDYFNESLLEISCAVRHATSTFFQLAVQQYGSQWFTEKVLPNISELAKSNARFQVRLTGIGCLRDVSASLDKNCIVEHVLPILDELSGDAVPNMRFNVAKSLQIIGKIVDNEAKKDVIVPIVKRLCDDVDFDVRYYAGKALEDLELEAE